MHAWSGASGYNHVIISIVPIVQFEELQYSAFESNEVVTICLNTSTVLETSVVIDVRNNTFGLNAASRELQGMSVSYCMG